MEIIDTTTIISIIIIIMTTGTEFLKFPETSKSFS